jgi:hypothetical protein
VGAVCRRIETAIRLGSQTGSGIFRIFVELTLDVPVNAVKMTADRPERLASRQGFREITGGDVHAVIEPQ